MNVYFRLLTSALLIWLPFRAGEVWDLIEAVMSNPAAVPSRSVRVSGSSAPTNATVMTSHSDWS